jgi:hypothetical protein
LTDTLQLLDYGHKKKAPPALYHPGKDRDDEVICALFRKREKKSSPSKKTSLTAQGTQGADDKNEVSNLARNEGEKPAGKPENGAKIEDQAPAVDLTHFAIYRNESGLHQAEVWKRGRRLVLELYESKSAPNQFVFGCTAHPKLGSSAGIKQYWSKTSGDKEHELERFMSIYRRYSGEDWAQPASKSSSGSHSASLDLPDGHHQIDLKTAFKRKGTSSGKDPAKELKVTKHSVAGGSGGAANGGLKTP